MAWPSAGPSRPYNLHQDLPPAPPVLPMKMPSPMHSPNPDQGWNPMNGNVNGNGQGYDAEDRGEGSKRNPLLDLMDSERTYVEQLALVIRVSKKMCISCDADLPSGLRLLGREKTFPHQNWMECSVVSRQSIGQTGLSEMQVTPCSVKHT